MIALSWGAGVQSTTLAVMSALGDLPRLDAIVHADTGWESAATYAARDWYIPWLNSHGIPVHIVTAGNIRITGADTHTHMPLWTTTGGPLNRKCTRHYKINPIHRQLRQLADFHASRPPAPPPASITLWLGISLDEFTRMKASHVQYITHHWPLIDRRMTRNDCADYLITHHLPVPPKSACIACPYRAASEYLQLAPDEREDAYQFDEANRHNPNTTQGADTREIYVWQDLIPLRDVDLAARARRERKGKQLPLMICEEGFCHG